MINTVKIWQSSADIYDKIMSHDFIFQLADGTLDINRFRFYLAQDRIYLNYYVRALSYLGAKSPSVNVTYMFSKHIMGASGVEVSLHSPILKKFGVDIANFKQSPSSRAYTDFLIAMTSSEPFHVGLAAVLPCYWIYREVGREIVKKMGKNNPYRVWAETYAGREYGETVQEVLDFIDSMKLDETQLGKMIQTFRLGAYYEYMFWDSAYRLEGWVINP